MASAASVVATLASSEEDGVAGEEGASNGSCGTAVVLGSDGVAHGGAERSARCTQAAWTLPIALRETLHREPTRAIAPSMVTPCAKRASSLRRRASVILTLCAPP